VTTRFDDLLARVAVGPDTPKDQRPGWVAPPPTGRCGVDTRYGRPCRQPVTELPCKYHDAEAYWSAIDG
jgi:hypothetical protein